MELYVYSKRILDETIKENRILGKAKRDNIHGMISSLKSIAAYKSLEYIELNHNCRDWINELLFDPSVNVKLTIKLLINDFTDSLMTRMRERDKFILSIVSNDYIFLCRSKGKEATITPI